MATFTEQLLRLDPRDAIVAMINEENQTNLTIRQVEISLPIDVGNGETQVTVTARSRATDADLDAVLPNGQLVYTYHRLDLSNYYAGTLVGFYPDLPSSSQILINELSIRTGHIFTEDDFVLEEILIENAVGYQLKSKAESLRFTGSLNVDIVDLLPITSITVDTDQLLSELHPVLRSYTIANPFLDAAAFSWDFSAVDFNQEVQYVPLFQDFISKTLHHTDRLLSIDSDDSGVLWISDIIESSPFNYWDARFELINTADSHPTNLHYNQTIKITFRDNQGLFLDDKVVYVPLLHYIENKAVFSNDARLQMNGGLHSGDGSAINASLNALQINEVITLSHNTIPFSTMDTLSGRLWGVDSSPSDFNLFSSVVIYNGTRLPHHGRTTSTNDGNLKRCIIFALSPTYNTMFDGDLIVLYEPTIKSIDNIPDNVNETTFNVDIPLLTLNGAARSPYTATITSGHLAPGHTLVRNDPNGQYEIVGTSSVPGYYSFNLHVTDSVGNYTDYKYSYRVYEVSLNLFGNAPNGVVNNPYSFTYTALGGYPPYIYSLVSGTPPFPINGLTGTIAGTPTSVGSFSWSVACTDSRGNVDILSDSLTFTVN